MTTGPKIEDHVSVSTACLELSEIAAIVADPRAGAISTFSGTTRDNHFGEIYVTAVHVEVNPKIYVRNK